MELDECEMDYGHCQCYEMGCGKCCYCGKLPAPQPTSESSDSDAAIEK